MEAAGVVLICGKLAVLAKRVFFWKDIAVAYGGYWSPFAGQIEENETAQEAAQRELFEESGVKLSLELFKFQKVIHKDKPFHLFIAEVDTIPEITLDEEHTELGTFLIDTLHTIEPIDEEIVECIKSYTKNRN